MNYGIVAEFNPFHNGHKHLIDSLKRGGENTVCAVMSESFVQRGECSCVSPYIRTKAAIMCGVDLVLSLPVVYATASAESFAFGGISVLGGLGCIDTLAFGSENGDTELLKECARVISEDCFFESVEKQLREGVSFPVARQRALEQVKGKELSDVLSTPNNILAVEYIKAINKLNLKMDVMAIPRCGVAHDSSAVCGNICSASALREMMEAGGVDFGEFLPKESYDLLKEEFDRGKAPASYQKLETAVLYRLRSMTLQEFASLPDVSEGLEYRFFEAVRTCAGLDEILEKVKTKRYTHSRLRRIVLCALLGVEKSDSKKNVPYIRVLGFNEKGAALLKKVKENSSLPIVTKASEIGALGEDAKRLFALECFARDVFSLALPNKDCCGKEMTDKIIVV